VHLDRAAAGGVGHAVEIAVDGDHAVLGDAALQPQHGLERPGRQWLQAGALLGEVLADDPPRGGMSSHVGDFVEPLVELAVEVVAVAEATAEEEVLPDIVERPFDLALCLGPVGLAGFWQVAVVAGELDQGAVVDDVVRRLWTLAVEHGFHAVVEDLGWGPAKRIECGGVAAQHGLHVLVRHEPAPQHAAVAEHQREQPDHALRAGLVGEHGAEIGEIDLGLPSGWRLEAHLEAGCRARPDAAEEVLYPRVAAPVSELAQLAVQSTGGQLGVGRYPLAQIGLERGELVGPGGSRLIRGWLETLLDVSTHGLSVEPDLPCDGRYAESLSMQIQDHDEFPKPDHHCSPRTVEGWWTTTGQRPTG